MGTSRYQHLEQLPAVSNNLQALAGLLTGPLALQLPTQHVTVIEDPVAALTVVSEVRRAADEATDTLVVYFAGHGLVDPQGALSLALPHTEFDRVETGLPYDWLRQVLLLNSRAERHVVILDCCYGGLALGRMSASPGLADQATVEGSFLLAAAAETRTALAPVGDTYTAFTGALLDTLRHGIPGGPALLDLGTIYQYLRRTLEARGHPVPQARDRNSGALVALGHNHAALPASSTVTPPGVETARRPWPPPSSVRTGPGASNVPRTQTSRYGQLIGPAGGGGGSHSAREPLGVSGPPADTIPTGGETSRPATRSRYNEQQGPGAAPPARRALHRLGRRWRGPRAVLIGTTCAALLAGGGWLIWKSTNQAVQKPKYALEDSATLQRAEKRGWIVVGVKQDQPGLSVTDPQGKKARGFEVDLVKFILEDVKFSGEVIFKGLVSENRETELVHENVDLIVASYSATKKRENEVDFSVPYYNTKQTLLMRKGRNEGEVQIYEESTRKVEPKRVRTLRDLPDGTDSCTVESSTSMDFMQSPAAKNKFDIHSQGRKSSYQDCIEGLLAEGERGSFEVVSTDDVILAGLAYEHRDKLVRLPFALKREQYRVGMRKGDPALQYLTCQAIQKMIKSKKWETSYNRHLKQIMDGEPANPPEEPTCS
ncbi:transporter substrate-binding domain-containing protein [Streptomyces sp. NPDC005963]|uniref:caspase, EACC1-associated type n=1 Tax=Streptomyces sp. NPDC005963 TaxID=3156721 RepID=UPI0033D55BD4